MRLSRAAPVAAALISLFDFTCAFLSPLPKISVPKATECCCFHRTLQQSKAKVSAALPIRSLLDRKSIRQTTRSSTALSLSLSPTTTVVASAVLHVLGGLLGIPSVFSATKEGGWYQRIDLPPWTPPNRVFGPTWSFLYACVGAAAGRAYVRGLSKGLLGLWLAHYVLNLLWAPTFFGGKRFRLGLWMNFVLLTSAAYVAGVAYRPVDAASAVLLVPYLGWLTFATALNWSICKRNPTVGGYNEAKLQSDLIRLQNLAAEYAGV